MIKVIENSVITDGSEDELATDLTVLLLIMREKHHIAYEVGLSVAAGKIIEDYKLRYEKE